MQERARNKRALLRLTVDQSIQVVSCFSDSILTADQNSAEEQTRSSKKQLVDTVRGELKP